MLILALGVYNPNGLPQKWPRFTYYIKKLLILLCICCFQSFSISYIFHFNALYNARALLWYYDKLTCDKSPTTYIHGHSNPKTFWKCNNIVNSDCFHPVSVLTSVTGHSGLHFCILKWSWPYSPTTKAIYHKFIFLLYSTKHKQSMKISSFKIIIIIYAENLSFTFRVNSIVYSKWLIVNVQNHKHYSITNDVHIRSYTL